MEQEFQSAPPGEKSELVGHKERLVRRREALKRMAVAAGSWTGLTAVFSAITSCQEPEDIEPFIYDSYGGSYSNYSDLYSSYFDYNSYSSYSSYSSYASYASYASYSSYSSYSYYNYSSYSYYNYYNYTTYYNYYVNYSDVRLKKNISRIENALSKIRSIHGVKFEYNDILDLPSDSKIGFIAQELQEILPEVVEKRDDYLAVNYGLITALLLEGIKEQQQVIDTMEKDNSVKQKEIEDLNSRITHLEELFKVLDKA